MCEDKGRKGRIEPFSLQRFVLADSQNRFALFVCFGNFTQFLGLIAPPAMRVSLVRRRR
jgi:hypothetical protein